MTDELVEIVDDAGNVIATVTRAEMRAKRLQHRSVGIAVMSTDGRLLVHRRSPDKDIWPGCWDIAAGAVVAAGETFDDGEVVEVRWVSMAELEAMRTDHDFVPDSIALLLPLLTR